MQTQTRSIFDWVIFALIHIVLIGGISIAGFAVYGWRLGIWVAASAVVAGAASMFLFAKDVPGETLMKCWLGLTVALNAAYIVHNGARTLGIQAYNDVQLRRYEIGMAQAARARSRRVAESIGMSVEGASRIQKMFDDGVSITAALLAFLELASAIVIFSIASRRSGASPETAGQPAGYLPGARRRGDAQEFPEDLDVKPTGPLPRHEGGKVFRR